MSKHITLDQLRAKDAWDAVKRVLKVGGNVSQEYSREVKRLPIRIRTAGLGQALGFLYAKSDKRSIDAKNLLLEDLAKWLLVERKLAKRPNSASDRSAILRAIVDGDAEFLRRATGEALMYLQWLGRFTEAEIKQD
ncbi:MAG: type III-B CRISPR module-associated protein Cmr5 [Bacteroidetes bacterium]|nr:type III-B CRISPR module-associated protein Cmr5 [Bacteroidota bacterium]